MDKRRKILEAQERLDKTLSSTGLSSIRSIESLVENQLLRTPFPGTEDEFKHLVQKRALEVFSFLEMLRSASGEFNGVSTSLSKNQWKIKQQTDQLRVLYREGPEGTPFHTLLCEGFVDGPVDCCLCVSWESTLYKTWWPQYSIPTFKIISSSSLQKVRIGEEISIVRVKVPWPLSEREALLHNFELEHLEEDLVIVLLNTIQDPEHVNFSTHGFTKDGILEPKDTVRIDVIGGFVLQKVSPSRSYFRAIANMDMKLDFVPPSLINFVARQLIGNGHKLYTKAVAAVAAGDKGYRDSLLQPMYARIHRSLYTDSETEENMAEMTLSNVTTEPVLEDEIKEEQDQHSVGLHHFVSDDDMFPLEEIGSRKGGASLSPEVEHALKILDEAIAILRNCRSREGFASFLVAKNDSELQVMVKEDVSLRNESSMESTACDSNVNGAHGSSLANNDRGGELMVSSLNHGIENGNADVQQSPTWTISNSTDRLCKTTDAFSLDKSQKSSPMTTQLPALERTCKVHDEIAVSGNDKHVGSDRVNKLARKKGHRRKKHMFCGLRCT